MGNTTHDQINRITTIASPNGCTRRIQMQQDASEAQLEFPIEGIKEAQSATYILTLALGTPLTLDDDGIHINVYHASKLLGYLGSDTSSIVEHIKSRGRVTCRLQKCGGSKDDLSASVVVWI